MARKVFWHKEETLSELPSVLDPLDINYGHVVGQATPPPLSNCLVFAVSFST